MTSYLVQKHQGSYDYYSCADLKVFLSKTKAEKYKYRLEQLFKKAYDFYNSRFQNTAYINEPENAELYCHLYNRIGIYEDSTFSVSELELVK